MHDENIELEQTTHLQFCYAIKLQMIKIISFLVQSKSNSMFIATILQAKVIYKEKILTLEKNF